MNLRLQAAFWVGALLFLLLFLWVFSGILLPFILGMALAYLLDPVADRLERAGMSRFWATITILLVAVLVVALLILIVVPVLVTQLTGFLERLPAYVEQLRALGELVLPDPDRPVFRARNAGGPASTRSSRRAPPGSPRCSPRSGRAGRRSSASSA